MMAALTMMGLAVRNAGAAKNILAGVINASAVAIFVFSKDVHWAQALITAIGALFGGWAGALMLRCVNEKLLGSPSSSSGSRSRLDCSGPRPRVKNARTERGP